MKHSLWDAHDVPAWALQCRHNGAADSDVSFALVYIFAVGSKGFSPKRGAIHSVQLLIGQDH